MACFTDSPTFYDVIVVGLGGHGSASLAHIAKSGKKVLGIEQFSMAHDKGSSHGKSRIYRQAYFEHPSYVPMLQRSLELWRELQEYYSSKQPSIPSNSSTSTALLNLCGGLMIGHPQSIIVEGTLRSIRAYDLPHEVLTPEQVRERFPVFHLKDDEIGVFETNAGYLNPELCIEAHVSLGVDHGAHVHWEEAMTSYTCSDEDGCVHVTTNRGEYECRQLVLSVGAWAPGLYGHALPFPLHVERRVLYWFDPPTPALYDGMPVYIWDMGDGRNFYGFPPDPNVRGAVKIAQHSLPHNPSNIPPSPEEVRREVTAAEVQEMRSFFEHAIPDLFASGAEGLVQSVACMYTMTPDEHFLIDFHPLHPNKVLCLSPCSGHGYKFCSAIGEMVVDMLAGGRGDSGRGWDLSLFKIQNRGEHQTV